MNYAAGFDAGERLAFTEHREGLPRDSIYALKVSVASDYGRGFIDGYTPRSATWGVVQHSPQTPVVEEVVYG